VRSAFKKSGGDLTPNGGHSWVFATRGRVSVPLPAPGGGEGAESAAAFEERLLDAAVGAGALDVEFPDPDAGAPEEGDEEPAALVWSEREALGAVREAVAAAGFAIGSADVVRVPNSRTAVPSDPETEEAFGELLAALEDNEDVTAI
jgi:transcriptional/translational regulatory protein YebC/TACO1